MLWTSFLTANRSKIARFERKVFFGTVADYDAGSKGGLWHVEYDDGDEEDFDEKDLKKALKLYGKKGNGDERKNSVTDAEASAEEDTLEDSGRLGGDSASREEAAVEESVEVSCALVVSVAISKYLSENNIFEHYAKSWEASASISTQMIPHMCLSSRGTCMD